MPASITKSNLWLIFSSFSCSTTPILFSPLLFSSSLSTLLHCRILVNIILSSWSNFCHISNVINSINKPFDFPFCWGFCICSLQIGVDHFLWFYRFVQVYIRLIIISISYWTIQEFWIIKQFEIIISRIYGWNKLSSQNAQIV